MTYSASYANLETMIPGIDTDPANINPGGTVPTYFSDQVWNGGSTITIAGPQWCSGLSKRVVALPGGFSKITLSYQIRVSQTAAAVGQAQENDLMIVDAAGNRYNGSTRKNNQAGGMWEIAKQNGDWVQTGFKAGLFAPDQWIPVSVIFLCNWAAKTISVTSITDNGVVHAIPANLQNVPATPNSGWQPSIIQLQCQETLMVAGAMTRDTKNIGISLA